MLVWLIFAVPITLKSYFIGFVEITIHENFELHGSCLIWSITYVNIAFYSWWKCFAVHVFTFIPCKTFVVTSFHELLRAFIVAIHMYTSLIGIKSKINVKCVGFMLMVRVLLSWGLWDGLDLRFSYLQGCWRTKYKRRQQSLGPLYIVVVVKATPARTLVITETVGHIPQCISDLKYYSTYVRSYKNVVSKICLKSFMVVK